MMSFFGVACSQTLTVGKGWLRDTNDYATNNCTPFIKTPCHSMLFANSYMIINQCYMASVHCPHTGNDLHIHNIPVGVVLVVVFCWFAFVVVLCFVWSIVVYSTSWNSISLLVAAGFT